MKKLKINIALIAMIVAATAAFAFKPAPVVQGKHAPVNWFYNGTASTEAAIKDGNNWDLSNAGSCSAAGTRPCEITVEDVSTQEDLDAYLDGFTRAQILAMSPNRKP